MLIINSILIIGVILFFILHFAYKDENKRKELYFYILERKINNKELIKEFIKLLEFWDKTIFNERLNLYQISYDYKEEELFELFYKFNYSKLNKEKLDIFLRINSLQNIEVQKVYNNGQKLILQMDLKENEFERWVYSNLWTIFYKNKQNSKEVKELFNLI